MEKIKQFYNKIIISTKTSIVCDITLFPLKKVFFILISAIVISSTASATDEFITKLDGIKINGKSIDTNKKEIIIRDNDSLTIFYSLLAPKDRRDNFLFKYNLKNSRNDSTYGTKNEPLLIYKSLFEEKWTLIVQAFDPRGKWLAEPLKVKFTVNNHEANLLAHIDSLEKKIIAKDSIIVDVNKKLKSSKTFDIVLPIIIIGALIIFAIIIILIIFGRLKKMKSNKPKDKMDNNVTLSKNEYDKIQIEVGNLRAEIAALRGQIDAMQNRANEMRNQNKELEERINRLSISKRELEELQKQKDELFAIIIHDIKNPASLIKSLVELLRSYDLTANEQQDIIHDIVETTSKIVSLSQEVSRVLALEGSRMKLDMEPINVNELITSIFTRNNVAAKNKNISMTCELFEDLPDCQCDPQKIEDVIDNLISNAIKFTHQNGAVKLRSRFENERVIIEISDTGLGLSIDDVQRAFQRGARLSAAPTAGETSSGLGLWIVKKLVEAHKGKVWVKSTLGRGSTFAFELPLEQYADTE
ncbi:MAG: HAMP domain-containing sensor histidine kinase [Candidatus Kapabacteria bacterium]|nr:HAMP domain-containing sensor histidine kinase [Candidatus Kapabacteria bacterium]